MTPLDFDIKATSPEYLWVRFQSSPPCVYTMFKTLSAALLLLFGFVAYGETASDAGSFLDQAVQLMEESPLLDTHIDLPQIIRSLSKSSLSTPPSIVRHV